jgi:HEAT repeat protein
MSAEKKARAIELLKDALKDPDPAIRAYSITALSVLAPEQSLAPIEALKGDRAPYTGYDFDKGRLSTDSVDALIRRITKNRKNAPGRHTNKV